MKGNPEPTTAVVLTFDVDPPTAVIVQHERFRTRPFIRQTVRCLNCQQFNHRQHGCHNHSRCARCGRQHRTGECELDTDQTLRCANCKGYHSAASPSCPQYLKVKEAWRIAATENMTYAKAISSVAKHTVVTKSKPDRAHALSGLAFMTTGLSILLIALAYVILSSAATFQASFTLK